jgi:hypothetical protein
MHLFRPMSFLRPGHVGIVALVGALTAPAFAQTSRSPVESPLSGLSQLEVQAKKKGKKAGKKKSAAKKSASAQPQ